MMNKIKISAVVMTISLAYSVNAMAENMSKDEYKSAKKNIVTEYKSANCGSLAGNVRAICKAEAKAKEKVAKAELEARYKPSKISDYKVSIAKAEADYTVARQKCNGKAGNDKGVCVTEAEGAMWRAKSDATAKLRISGEKVTAPAREKSSEARMKEQEKVKEAYKDSATAKRDADYAVAREKCDALAGSAKNSCVTEAKKFFGK